MTTGSLAPPTVSLLPLEAPGKVRLESVDGFVDREGPHLEPIGFVGPVDPAGLDLPLLADAHAEPPRCLRDRPASLRRSSSTLAEHRHHEGRLGHSDDDSGDGPGGWLGNAALAAMLNRRRPRRLFLVVAGPT